MLLHPKTVATVLELEYQERLREAAQQRLAASAERSAPAGMIWLRTVQDAASWLAMRRLLRMCDARPLLAEFVIGERVA